MFIYNVALVVIFALCIGIAAMQAVDEMMYEEYYEEEDWF